MPPRNINYSKTVIYKIVSKDDNIKACYVGSTINFIKIKNEHENAINDNLRKNNIYLYEFVKDNGGWEKFEIKEVENYEAKDSKDQLSRKRFWIEKLGATLNKEKILDKKNIDEYILVRQNEKKKEDEIINKRRLLIREQQKEEIIIKNDTPDINKIHVLNGVIVFPEKKEKTVEEMNKEYQEEKLLFPLKYREMINERFNKYIRPQELKNYFGYLYAEQNTEQTNYTE